MLTDDEKKLEEILSIGRVKDNNKSAETERQTEKREKKITPLMIAKQLLTHFSVYKQYIHILFHIHLRIQCQIWLCLN